MKVRIRIVVLAVVAMYFLVAAVAMDYHSKRRIAENMAERNVVNFGGWDDETEADGVDAVVQDPEWAEELLIDECEAHYAASELPEMEGAAISAERVRRDWEMDGTVGEAIRQIASGVGVIAIISEALSDTHQIHVRLKNLTALEALQRIARDAGGVMEERNGDYFFMSLTEMTVDAPPPPVPVRPEDRVIVRFDKALVIEVDGDMHTALKTIARAAGVSLRVSRSALDNIGTVHCRLQSKTPVQAIQIIVKNRQLGLVEIGGAFVVLSKEEMQTHYDRLVPIIGIPCDQRNSRYDQLNEHYRASKTSP